MLRNGMIGELKSTNGTYEGSFRVLGDTILFARKGFGSEWTITAFETMIDCYEFEVIDCTDEI